MYRYKDLDEMTTGSKESVRKIYGLERLCCGCMDRSHYSVSSQHHSLIPMPMMDSLNLPKKMFDSLRISSILLRTVGRYCLCSFQNRTEILKSFTGLIGTETACDHLIFVIGDDAIEMYSQEIINCFIVVLHAETVTI
ncbi:hypothetical protein CRE_03247 [Caenorhabditis remanei]|uniref:Uncharacterized protein n=1 Tax=Caenorhabditis remanei TaxID=31234 RepID=E3MMK2_CAERE|nr:hypothetical protein CRE_03247 [Caenorhabditis remanei]